MKTMGKIICALLIFAALFASCDLFGTKDGERPDSYTVKYHANGGSGNMANSIFAYDKEFKLPSNAFIRDGYVFALWTSRDPDSPIDDSSSAYYYEKYYWDGYNIRNGRSDVQGTLNLYALWYKAFTVRFEANGGSGEMADAVFSDDPSYQILPRNTFTRDGYAFMGWATSPDGPKEYDDEARIGDDFAIETYELEAGETVTLYAVWRAGDFTVLYNANGGSGSMSSQAFIFDVEQELSKNAFTRGTSLDRIMFIGWVHNPFLDSLEVDYTDGQLVKNLTTLVGGTVTLYAKWRASSVVFFSPGGGTGSMGYQYFPSDVPQVLPANTFTRPGYVFAGWSTSSSADRAVEYGDQESFTLTHPFVTGGSTLYAVWDIHPDAYFVRYGRNDADETISSNFQPFTPGEAQSLWTNVFAKPGYTVQGWATSPNGAMVYTNGQSVTDLAAAGETVTLYAVWKVNTCTVTYNANGGSGEMADSSFTYGEEQNLRKNTFTRPGYTFRGWATSASAASPAYSDEQSGSSLTTTANGAVTLYALWGRVYTVTYDKNAADATGTMEDSLFVEDEAQNLRANAFTRAGYAFVGWATSASAASPAYSDGQSIRRTSSGTLYAVWRTVYTVTYDANGGSGDMADTHFVYDIAQNLRLNAFTRTGYAFMGWSRSSTATSRTYTDGQSVSYLSAEADGIVPLFAVWSAGAYTVAYDANGGSGTMYSQAFTFGIAQNLYTNDFARTGYTFAGWTIAANGSGTVYADGQSVFDMAGTMGATVTLHAKWNAIVYYVNYDRNGGSGNMDSQSFTYDIAQNLRANTFTRTGYTFVGWAMSPNDPAVYADGQNVSNLTATAYGSITLYAVWKAHAYTVVYHANSGDGSMADSAFTYDAPQNLPPNTFTRLNYRLDGWATTASGAVAYANGQSVSNLTAADGATVNLYAVWNNKYTVKYNGSGSTSGTMADSSFTYGVTQNLPNNNFSRTGYTFMGWSMSANGEVAYTNGQSVTDLVTTSEGATVTLYAKWEANKYTVRYDKNSTAAAGTMEDSLFTYGVSQNLRTNGFTRTGGYVFRGWATAANSSEVTHTDGRSVSNLSATNGATVTLYAVWSNTYTVVYNASGGEGTMNNQVFGVGQAQALRANAFTRSYYTFQGWATAANRSTVAYTNGQSVSNLAAVGETITLYAVWQGSRCTVVFNANGGSGSMSNQSFVYGTAQNLRTNGFTRSYYTFQGWATAANSTTVTYANGQSVSNLSLTDGATINLYAVWKGATVTVTYNANGGTGGTAAQTFIYGTAQPLRINNFTRDDYSFSGWAVTPDGGKKYSGGQNFNVEGSGVTIRAGSGGSSTYSCTLYAMWSKN